MELPAHVETLRTSFPTSFDACRRYARASPSMLGFRRMPFPKIVPRVEKLGLLDGWLRDELPGLGILQHEDLEVPDVPALAAEPERVVLQ